MFPADLTDCKIHLIFKKQKNPHNSMNCEDAIKLKNTNYEFNIFSCCSILSW